MLRILYILIICFCWTFSYGQNTNHIKNIQQKADSLVSSFWGQDNFQKYIHLDKTRSEYLVFGKMWEKQCKFNSKLTFSPNKFLFRYKVIHPVFQGDTAHVEFYLDSLGKLEVGFTKIGFFQGSNLDTLKTLTKEQAIKRAKELGLDKGQDKWTVTLSWQETDPMTLDLKENSTLKEFIQGHFTWNIKATLDKSYRDGCFYYNKRVYSIDILTGKLIAKSDVGEIEPTKGRH
jgi:fido (protein-threonine AMPylation protein)